MKDAKRYEVETTGDVRKLLANTLKGIVNGDMDVKRADEAWKVAKAMHDSIYCETKVALLRLKLDQPQALMGDLRLGGSEKK